jgi:hypothetical protein
MHSSLPSNSGVTAMICPFIAFCGMYVMSNSIIRTAHLPSLPRRAGRLRHTSPDLLWPPTELRETTCNVSTSLKQILGRGKVFQYLNNLFRHQLECGSGSSMLLPSLHHCAQPVTHLKKHLVLKCIILRDARLQGLLKLEV